MHWTLSDRANLVGLIALVVIAAVAVTPILLGSSYLPLMAVAALSIVSAWRMSLARTVRVDVDDLGITKTTGSKTWRLAWDQIGAARLTRFLGTDQLLLTAESLPHWSATDRLFGLGPAGTRAVQVPTARLDELHRLLDAHGLSPR
jgi:hypothetical protein